MKFLADMGISPNTVLFLQQLGHEAVHISALGKPKAPDSEILLIARTEKRIVLTHDLDFGDLMAASQSKLPSVVIFRLGDMRPENVNNYLNVICQAHQQALEAGAILSVTERRIRVRQLPIQPGK
jgi:predicted nuclease of predicted toxin-antitoxin system